MANLALGIYEALLDEDLSALLAQHPELKSVFAKVDPEEEPARYAAFLARVIEKALTLEPDPIVRLHLCNEIVDRVAGRSGAEFLRTRRLVGLVKPLLLEITPPHYAASGVPRPETPLAKSTLFTGSPSDPQLVHELIQEMQSADSVDVLISFIKWSGLRLLIRGFEELSQRGGKIRIITTSYMGASDAEAIEWLARLGEHDRPSLIRHRPNAAAREGILFPSQHRVFNGVYWLGQHVPGSDDQRIGVEPQGDCARSTAHRCQVRRGV